MCYSFCLMTKACHMSVAITTPTQRNLISHQILRNLPNRACDSIGHTPPLHNAHHHVFQFLPVVLPSASVSHDSRSQHKRMSHFLQMCFALVGTGLASTAAINTLTDAFEKLSISTRLSVMPACRILKHDSIILYAVQEQKAISSIK